jgi:hypothetical protein
MGKSAVSENFYQTIGKAFSGEDNERDLDAEVGKAREVTANEQMWLEGQLDGNGRIDEYDQAVLEFLAEESGFTR